MSFHNTPFQDPQEISEKEIMIYRSKPLSVDDNDEKKACLMGTTYSNNLHKELIVLETLLKYSPYNNVAIRVRRTMAEKELKKLADLFGYNLVEK